VNFADQDIVHANNGMQFSVLMITIVLTSVDMKVKLLNLRACVTPNILFSNQRSFEFIKKNSFHFEPKKIESSYLYNY
jgi:hypothetical protein